MTRIAEWQEENELQARRSIPPDQKICVCVRKRPLNGKETRAKETDIISRDSNVCIVHQPQTKVDLTKYLEHQKFRFDYTFDAEDDNRKVFYLFNIIYIYIYIYVCSGVRHRTLLDRSSFSVHVS